MQYPKEISKQVGILSYFQIT